jgi:hypothetical protein
MKRAFLVSFSFVVMACGPSYGGGDIKTPDEVVAEQEAMGAEQEKNQRNGGDYDDSAAGETDEEKKRKWDDNQADLELRRAARSAESCPESVTEKAEKGRAAVTLIFANDGHVKEATIGAPYEEKAVGKCVLRAMKAVIVPAYEGAEKTVQYEIDLTGAKKSGPVGAEGEAKKAEE